MKNYYFKYLLLIFWVYLIVYVFFDNLYNIFIYFFNFLISLFYVSPDTKSIHRDRYALRPSESMTNITTLNHATDRRDIIGGAIPQPSGKSEDWAHSFHALRESEKPGPEIQDVRKSNEGDRRWWLLTVIREAMNS